MSIFKHLKAWVKSKVYRFKITLFCVLWNIFKITVYKPGMFTINHGQGCRPNDFSQQYFSELNRALNTKIKVTKVWYILAVNFKQVWRMLVVLSDTSLGHLVLFGTSVWHSTMWCCICRWLNKLTFYTGLFYIPGIKISRWVNIWLFWISDTIIIYHIWYICDFGAIIYVWNDRQFSP